MRISVLALFASAGASGDNDEKRYFQCGSVASVRNVSAGTSVCFLERHLTPVLTKHVFNATTRIHPRDVAEQFQSDFAINANEEAISSLDF
jgi:hypothetical protein